MMCLLLKLSFIVLDLIFVYMWIFKVEFVDIIFVIYLLLVDLGELNDK